jgi:tetratricopeptide (TPR) repeat protein
MRRTRPTLAVDPKSSALLVDGVERRVTPRAMAVLVRLLDAGGGVVSKDELVAEVWDGAAVTDDVISTAIYELRRALGDDARAPRYIETLRKSGYRWLGPPVPRVIALPPGPPRVTRLLRAATLSLFGLLALWMTPPAPRAAEPGPVPAACDLYQRGMQVARAGDHLATRRAIEYLQRALELDPTFVPAHLGLAELYLDLSARQPGPVPSENYWRARAAIERAARLGAEPSEVLAVRAALDLRWDADWRRAEADLRLARERSSCGRGSYDVRLAELLSARGRHDEAFALLESAIAGEPSNARGHWLMARVLYHARRYVEARTELMAALELEPWNPASLRLLGAIDVLLGEPRSAADVYFREARLAGVPAAELSALEQAFAEEGLPGVLRWRLREPDGLASLGPVDRAAALVQLGNNQGALAALARAFAERRPDLIWLRVDPMFEPLRSEPAFRALLGRLERSPSVAARS